MTNHVGGNVLFRQQKSIFAQRQVRNILKMRLMACASLDFLTGLLIPLSLTSSPASCLSRPAHRVRIRRDPLLNQREIMARRVTAPRCYNELYFGRDPSRNRFFDACANTHEDDFVILACRYENTERGEFPFKVPTREPKSCCQNMQCKFKIARTRSR